MHKRYLVAMRLMIFITQVWSGLCKLTAYQLLNVLMSFGPTQLHVIAPKHYKYFYVSLIFHWSNGLMGIFPC